MSILQIVEQPVELSRTQLLNPTRRASRLHLVQPGHELDEFCPTLVIQLVWVASEDGLKDRNQLGSELTDSGVFPLV